MRYKAGKFHLPRFVLGSLQCSFHDVNLKLVLVLGGILKMSRLSRLKLRKLALATSCLLALSAGTANAAGIGKINVFSGLGQPLKAEIELNATADELTGMTARLASSDVFKQTGVEYMSQFSELLFSIDKGSKGKPVIKVASLRPVNEPFLDLLVELNWSAGKIVREFTFLLDPPLSPKAVSRVSVATVEARPLEQLPDLIREKETRVKPIAESVSAIVPQSAQKTASSKKHTVKEPAPTDAGATSQDSRLVKQGDTLAKIADQLRPEGVSLDQMLASLYKTNPDAFIGKSIHRLKAGAILKVPDAQEASDISEPEAKKFVRAQARDWHGYRTKLAQSVADLPAKDAPDTQVSTGKVTPKLDEKPIQAEKNKDQVKVGKAEQSKQSSAAKDEERIAKDLAAKEAQERVAALEKTVSDMQRLLEMKDQKLALLEKQGQEKATQPKVSAEPAPVPVAQESKPSAQPAPAEPAPASQAKPADPPSPEVKDKQEMPSAENKAPPPEVPKPVEAPAPTQELPDEPPELLDVLAQQPALVGGAVAGLLALLSGFVFWRRKKVTHDMASTTLPMSDMSLTPSSVFNGAGGQVVDTDKSPMTTADFSQTGPGSIDTDEVDPVAEADVYMAYGRDVQAEEILIEAMDKDPMRLAIPVKLLEIYANRRSLKQFEALASELYSRTSGQGADWQKVAAMGALLDPANPLYSAGEKLPDAPLANEAELDGLEFAQTRLLDLPVGSDGSTEAIDSLSDMSLELPGASDENDQEADHVLDFDVGTATNPLYAIEEMAQKIPDEPEVNDEALEFELPGEDSTEFVTSFSNAKTLEEVEAEQIEEDDSPLEFDINLSESVVMGADLPQFDISSINLDLAPEQDTTSVPEEANLDFNSLDLSLDSVASDSDVVEEDTFDPALREEVSTKLDLAKAYEEMGDVEGAKELLSEVIADGPKDLVVQAEEILARLGA